MCLEAERRRAGGHVAETIDLVNRSDTRDTTLVALLKKAQQQWVAEHSLVVSAADTASGEKSAEGERKASQARRGWRGWPNCSAYVRCASDGPFSLLPQVIFPTLSSISSSHNDSASRNHFLLT